MVRLGQGPMSLSRRLINYLESVTSRPSEFCTHDKFKVSIALSTLLLERWRQTLLFDNYFTPVNSSVPSKSVSHLMTQLFHSIRYQWKLSMIFLEPATLTCLRSCCYMEWYDKQILSFTFKVISFS